MMRTVLGDIFDIVRFGWRDKRIWALAAGLSWLLCFCIPINDMYGKDRFAPYKPTAAFVGGFVLGVALFFLLLSALSRRSLKATARNSEPPRRALPATPPREGIGRGAGSNEPPRRALPATPPREGIGERFLVCAVMPALSCALAYAALFPGIFTADSASQLRQVLGLEPFYDWHPIGHTLLFFGIPYVLSCSVYAVTVWQMLFFACTWAALFAALEGQGFRRGRLLVLQAFLVCVPTNLFLSVSVWKDIPFSCAGALTTLLLWKRHREGRFRRPKDAVLLGLCLGLMAALRHNGPLVALVILACLVCVYRKERRVFLALGAAAALFLGVRFVGFGILHARPNHPAVPFRWFTQIAAGVLAQGATATSAQADALSAVMPLPDWVARYDPYSNDKLMNTNGVKVWQPLADNRMSVARAALSLAARHPVKALRAELCITELTWRILPLGPVNVTSYQNHDLALVGPIRPSALFARLKNAMERVRTGPVLRILFARHGPYFFLTLLLLAIALARREKRAFLIFLPALLNVASMWVSMPSQDYRYVYLTVLVFPVLCGVVVRDAGRQS